MLYMYSVCCTQYSEKCSCYNVQLILFITSYTYIYSIRILHCTSAAYDIHIRDSDTYRVAFVVASISIPGYVNKPSQSIFRPTFGPASRIRVRAHTYTHLYTCYCAVLRVLITLSEDIGCGKKVDH